MKVFVLLFALLSATITYAKSYTVTGDEAKVLMETLASAGYSVSNLDEEWEGKTFRLVTGPMNCHYNNNYYPDAWMSSVECSKGTVESRPKLKNSLALARALNGYDVWDAGLGSVWMSVDNIDCSLVNDTMVYNCIIESTMDSGWE